MKINKTILILLIFAVTGAVLWMFGGFVVNIVCFKPTNPPETLMNQELARQSLQLWGIRLKVTVTWAVAGAVMGLLILIIFKLRPQREYTTATHMAPPSPGFLVFLLKPGPETVAEISTATWAVILGMLSGTGMAVYILPLFKVPDILVPGGIYVRIIMGFIVGGIVTILILPLSLKRVKHMLDKRAAG